jgi:SAM-dependent methyltransferase
MAESQPWTTQSPEALRRRVPVWQRALRVDDLIVVDGHRAHLPSLMARFATGGYRLQETPHFLLFTRAQDPGTVLVHRFGPDTLDADLGHYLLVELKPCGLLQSPADLGRLFAGVVGSLAPQRVAEAWRLYARNTLRQYRRCFDHEWTPPLPEGPVAVFGTLYRRVSQLVRGTSLLDAGCSFGLLPLLLAERCPQLRTILGVDVRPDAFITAQELAAETGLRHVRFAVADLRSAEEMGQLGRFGTVVALHVLEHFDETEVPVVLRLLLTVTERRLMVAVPYEELPEAVYGHRQVFTPARLAHLGRLCLQWWGGGEMRLEECMGGLLVVDRECVDDGEPLQGEE